MLTPAGTAQLFHETYERLAPDFGYRTREASAKPWANVPEQNRALMTATSGHVLAEVLRAAAECLDAYAASQTIYGDWWGGMDDATTQLRALAEEIGDGR